MVSLVKPKSQTCMSNTISNLCHDASQNKDGTHFQGISKSVRDAEVNVRESSNQKNEMASEERRLCWVDRHRRVRQREWQSWRWPPREADVWLTGKKYPQCSFGETLKMSLWQLINILSVVQTVGHMCSVMHRLALILYLFIYLRSL